MDVFSAKLDYWILLLDTMNAKEWPETLPEAILLAAKSMCRLLQLVAMWPVTTGSCERSIRDLGP